MDNRRFSFHRLNDWVVSVRSYRNHSVDSYYKISRLIATWYEFYWNSKRCYQEMCYKKLFAPVFKNYVCRKKNSFKDTFKGYWPLVAEQLFFEENFSVAASGQICFELWSWKILAREFVVSEKMNYTTNIFLKDFYCNYRSVSLKNMSLGCFWPNLL